MRSPPEVCLAVLKRFEGFTPTAKIDEGVPAIGYGHRMFNPADPLREATITPDHAGALALADMIRVATHMAVFLGDTLVNAMSDGQYAAVLDFAYNLGTGAFDNSTLAALIRRTDWEGAGAQFVRWVYAKDAEGQEIVLANLKQRRDVETALWNGTFNSAMLA